MSIRLVALVILLAGIIPAPGGAAPTESDHDPIIKLESSTSVEVDLGMMIDDLLPTLLESLEAEDEDSAEMTGFLLNQLGLDALQLLKMEALLTKEKSTSRITITLDPDKEDGLLYSFFTTPNGRCGFGDYIYQDELVMFMTLHNFSSYLETTLDFMARPEIADLLGDMPTDENGDLLIGTFSPRKDLLPLLSGELDFFLLESPDDSAVELLSAPYSLVLGSHDGFALRDSILELMAMLGMDLTEMLNSEETYPIGDFEFTVLPFGGALAVSEDYLVISMDPVSLAGMLLEKGGNLKVPDGIEWGYMDGPGYSVYMESMLSMASVFSSDESNGNELMMKIYSTLFEYIETEEVLVRSQAGGLEIRTEVDGPVMTGLYEMTYVMLQELPALMEMQRLRAEEDAEMNDYQGAVDIIDKAMMVYAEDHDGAYPETPEELFSQGYMKTLPQFAPSPAGAFLEWGYTYHTLRDENGIPDGYFLFLYGGNPQDGFDVYTPENLLDTENFLIGRDGVADGVASFCYDGSAIEQVDRYFE